MNAEDVKRRVEVEIGERWEREYPHGVQLRRCLVVPRKERMRAGWDDTAVLDLWVVLEEDPIQNAGYLVAYDEAVESFGLASRKPEGDNVFLGYYGSFIETLEAM